MRALRSDGGRDGAAPVRADRLRWGFRDETVQQTASVRGIKTIVHLLARGRLTFLGHCIHGVICEIRTRFIRRTCGARALPSADVNTAQICARAYERERERGECQTTWVQKSHDDGSRDAEARLRIRCDSRGAIWTTWIGSNAPKVWEYPPTEWREDRSE